MGILATSKDMEEELLADKSKILTVSLVGFEIFIDMEASGRLLVSANGC